MGTQQATLAERLRLIRGRLSTTPGRLQLALAGTWLLALVFLLAVLAAVHDHRQAMQTIGKDSAPSIIAAQDIKASLAAMHGHAAEILLAKPGMATGARSTCEERRLKVTEGLLTAAGNITYGDAERTPIRTLLNELGHYQAVFAQAQALQERGDAGFLGRHREADRILHDVLLPAAKDLDQANREALDESYGRQKRSSWFGQMGVLASAAALLACLGATQVFLFRRMRRIVNPALAAATVLGAGFFAYTLGALWLEMALLKTAKEDAFESIHALWKARAVAYDAHGDLLRARLDRDQAPAYTGKFNEKRALLAQFPGGVTPEALPATVGPNKVPAGFKGYLAAELGNVTFAGEGQAALDTLRAYLRWVAVAHAHPAQGAAEFAEFDKALGQTLKINQDEFDRAVERGFAVLAGFDVWAPLAALGIAVLATLGLRPRLREYAAY
jgi:hypothetical protein